MLTSLTSSWWQTPILLAGAATLLAALLGHVVNTMRARRDRWRDEFARALSATVAYREFPYAVRRRRHDDPAAERVRLSESLREVQQSLAYHSALIRTESAHVGASYDRLVRRTREVIGPQIRDAWQAPPASNDADMNISIVTMNEIVAVEQEFVAAVRDHLRPMLPAVLARWTRQLFGSGPAPTELHHHPSP